MQGFGIAGNLVDVPQVTHTSSGKSVARFTLAVDDGYRDKSGAWSKREPIFHKVETWNDAETARTWPKGALVVVVGQFRADTYEVDGDKRRQQWLAADVAALVPRLKRGTETPAAAPAEDDPYEAAK